MTIRGLGHRNFLTEASWVLLISLFGLSGRGFGQTYDGFSYSRTSPGGVTITGYSGPGGAVSIPSSIPEVGTVIAIGSQAFESCGLSSVTIPNSVTNIGDDAFDFSSSLTNITIGDSVTSFGDLAFAACTSLSTVTIPNSVTSIGNVAFLGCTSLREITVDPNNTAYSSLNGVLFNKSQSLLIQCPGGLAGAYTIPNSVTSIGDSAFQGCTSVASVTSPDRVTTIAYGAFDACTSLASLTIGNSVTSIGDGAFEFCTKLTSITIPNSVTSIGVMVFLGCSNMTSAYFQGNSPSSFGADAFGLTASSFTIYYPATATGWTTPTENGYRARPYNYTPSQQLPVLSLARSLGAVTLSFNGVGLGTNYQLQVSTDLSTWTNTGPAFTVNNATGVYPQPFAVRSSEQLFFRLVSP